MASKGRKSGTDKGKRTEELANYEIAVIATYLVGGQYRHADTEDIAIKANEIAPGRFTWRKYKKQVNIDIVRKRLWDAILPNKGAYLIGSERNGWLLTERGIAFAKGHAANLESVDLSKTRRSAKEKAWVNRERERMTGELAFEKFMDGEIDSVTSVEAERFFRIDDYVVGKARAGKIERVINHLSSDPVVGPAVQAIARKIKENA
jgi:hypothetical protein